MKILYIVYRGLWSNKKRVVLLMLQIFLASLILNLLTCKFVYLGQIRQIVWTSNLGHAVCFVPAPRFAIIMDEKRNRMFDNDYDDSRYMAYYKMMNQIKNFPGISSIGSIHNGGYSVIYDKTLKKERVCAYQIYDKPLIENLNLPLDQGKLSNLGRRVSGVPVIISQPLGKMYGGLGSNIELVVIQKGKRYVIRTVVVGVMPKDHYLYSFPGGGNTEENLLLTSLLSRQISHQEDYRMIMPPFILPDGSTPITAEEPGFICFTQDSVNLDYSIKEWKTDARKNGLGFIIPFQDMNARQILFTLKNNRNYISIGIIVFLVALAGIGGFNILRLIANKREVGIYLMFGMNWKLFTLTEFLMNGLIAITPVFFALATTYMIAVSNPFKMLFGPFNYLLSILIIVIFIIFSVLVVHYMTRQQSIVMLMRKDVK